MSTWIRTLAVLSVLAVCPSAARAASVGYGAYVWGTINNQGCGSYATSAASNPDCLFVGTDPRFWNPYLTIPYQPYAQASGSKVNAFEQISASANLATGDLSVQL